MLPRYIHGPCTHKTGVHYAFYPTTNQYVLLYLYCAGRTGAAGPSFIHFSPLPVFHDKSYWFPVVCRCVCAGQTQSRTTGSLCVCLHRKIRLVSRNTLIKAPEPIKRNSIISYIMYLRGKTLVGSFLLFLPEFFSSFLEGVPCVLLCMLMSGESISPISFFCVTYISSFLLICSAEPAVAMLFFFCCPQDQKK